MLSDFTYNNGVALQKLVNEHDVQLRRYPDEVLEKLRTIGEAFISDLSNESELTGRIYASFQAYTDIVRPWTAISERPLLNLRSES